MSLNKTRKRSIEKSKKQLRRHEIKKVLLDILDPQLKM